jgi:hypothetical protein
LILEQLIDKIKRRQLLELRKISKDSCPAKPTCVYIWIKSHANIEMWKIIKISPLYFKNVIWTKLFFLKSFLGFGLGVQNSSLLCLVATPTSKFFLRVSLVHLGAVWKVSVVCCCCGTRSFEQVFVVRGIFFC